ncbi:hypothetical protein NBRC10512_005177 [Rhodotorula toruloides]|uniref:RHTO0S02e13410g1_1 n=2 Tax=Rhodotorula toruloides TaxID=5286 RepID=A0A061AIB7_RHOTO|nr:CBS and PB1 domain containing protein [Rhodotorula toruloides NP11]EMS23451.1 CBS and PB1 domain containing protein [Rhodotorula toruloides NP11]CDR37320.1 RHTO0S02e13410g1_1 [Rhodotorula toruloides]
MLKDSLRLSLSFRLLHSLGMSRIPVPTHHTPQQSTQPASPAMSRPSQRSRPESVYSASGSSFVSSASAVPSTPPTSVGGGDGLAETRKRQSRRDEAIRKKIESELARKRPPSKRSGTTGGTSHRAPKPKQGTVSALRPLPALTVPAAMSVADASQLCAAKRTDCVLVVDENEHLCGIFTAKDLAFRVVGDGLDPRNTPVSAIMTPNPMVTRDTTSATEALQTMVTRGFRHLPVCNEDGDVVGLLDITKVFHESLEKLEKAYGSSQRLYSALEGAQEQFGAVDTGAANPLLAYVQALRDKMSFPDLGSILDARTTAATVGVKTSVREAAKLMREKRTTAVVVVEGDGKKIAGIFTSKDVVLRVIAAGLDSKTCSVVRVMTPHPDVALPSLSIQDALRKMNDGHYLNLPVVDEAGALIGIVDVLKLTYATLEQVNSLHVEGGADAAGGPLWGRFFSAAAQAAGDDDDTESMVSGVNGSEAASSQAPPFQTPTRPGYHRSKDSIDTPGSELYPNDSASVIHDDGASDLAPAPRRPGQASSVGGASSQALPIVDDGTYLFKFVAPGGTTHRFQARYDSHEFLLDIVSGKLSSDPFFAEQSEDEALPKADPKDFSISYRDDDGDLVLMTADRDVTDAVQTAKQQGKDRVVLHVSGGQSWKAALAAKEDAAAAAPAVATTKKLVVVEEGDEERIEEEEQDAAAEPTKRKSSKKAPAGDELVGGVLPKEYLLPASIGFLGVVIAGVFIASRASASSR